MYTQRLSSLEFFTYAAFFAVVVLSIAAILPGRKAPVRTEAYSDDELKAHDRRLPKYFLTGGAFLLLGGIHMVLKNLPWTADWLARAGYAGHLVRDLSNTHVMIVGGGTLISTGLCWYVLPRIVARPLSSPGLAQGAFWFTAVGLLVFYIALIANGIAMGRLVSSGWDYEAAKLHMGKAYRVPVGIGAGVMGLGYWCFAANVFLTIFQSRLVRVPKPSGHLWKFLATGAAGLTVGTVQGVIQVQPAHADWLYRAGHAGEWIDPISHAHINLVTGLTMLTAGALFALAPALGGKAPTRRVANLCFWSLLSGSLAFYGVALFLGFHEGRLVVRRGLTPEQAEEATRLHPFLIMGAGIAMMAAFWFLLVTLVRSFRHAHGTIRAFVLAGCAALAVGTLQGPVQAFPAVNELLDRGGDAGDVIVNLHAQLNMLAGLMVILMGAALALTPGALRSPRSILAGVGAGMAVYYAGGIAFAAVEANRVSNGGTFGAAVAALEPWQALVLVPAALAVAVGFGSYARATWRGTEGYRAESRGRLRRAPSAYAGRIPKRVRRRRPTAVAAYEVPMGLLGFPGVGWLFAGYPLAGTALLLIGPAIAWAAVPLAFTPFSNGPLVQVGWQAELVWLPASTFISTVLLFRAHRRRRLRLLGSPPRRRGRRSYRTRVAVSIGAIGLLLVTLPFVPAVAGIGGSSVRYAYQTGFTREVTGQFVGTPRGTIKLFAWRDPQETFPADALRLRARDVLALRVRAAAVDAPGAYRLFDLDGNSMALTVRRSSPRELILAPAQPLQPGRYVFAASHEGMFGGRDFAYLRVVAPGEPVTVVSRNQRTDVPAVADAVPPIAAALLAAAFALLLLRSLLRRAAGQKALWAVGFALFAVAAASEAAAQRAGWNPALFRLYYIAGGVLTVAYLGAGSAWLLLPRRGRDVLVGGLAVATVAAITTVLIAPVDVPGLAAAHSGQPPANGVLGGHAFLWAVVLNSFGTLLLVGGSLLSIARRQRVRANVWIASGALTVAAATGLSRTGDMSLVYLGELVGIALMFCGFTLPAPAPKRVRESEPAPRPAVVAR
ncbi:MAG: cbb3-type cytochrome c oxidase subunit I [Actinomycetota bacterium]|nr:cbb3-type cytochrome c oxidase subunit I [Actinomycetota bacterium]